MDRSNLETIRAQLHEDRKQTEARLAALEHDFRSIVDATRDANTDDEHDPEGSTIAFERSQTSALAASARRHLTQIDAALTRLADGSYGVCEVCGEQIPLARLEARPVATRCIQHA